MRRLAPLAIASLLPVLTLAGCATEDRQPQTATDRDLEVQELEPGVDPEGFDAGTGEAPTRCSDMSPAADGRYPVGDAGVVTVRLDEAGEALVLAEVETAEGWEHEVAQEDDVQVDVRFTPPDGDSAAVALVATLGDDPVDVEGPPPVLVQFCDDVA